MRISNSLGNQAADEGACGESHGVVPGVAVQFVAHTGEVVGEPQQNSGPDRQLLRRRPLGGQSGQLRAIGGREHHAELGYEHAHTVPKRLGEVQ